MARGVKELVQTLSAPGSHVVLRGDLALVGLPGLVFTPSAGLGLPGVALGHGWLQPATRYAGLLRHLASWGIVALAPDTQRGPLPSTLALASDLRTALDVGTGVRLGGAGSPGGDISVDPGRLALLGHGTGGGAAVVAAAADDRVRAVTLFAPAETHPSAIDAARSVHAPGLLLVAGKDTVAPPEGHAVPIAQAWAGPVAVHALPKASHLGFVDGRHWTTLLLDGRPERATQRLTRAWTTAFLLRHLTGARKYDALLETAVPLLTGV
ncbi:MAG TPA: dienelactone hydrolase family protein [Pseudonocardiaceae bacterium]